MFKVDEIIEASKTSRFNNVEKSPKRIAYIRETLDKLSHIDTGNLTIRNVEYNDMKDCLNRIAEDAFDNIVKVPFVYDMKWKKLSESAYEFETDTNVMGLVGIKALSNKVKKAKIDETNEYDVGLMKAVQTVMDLLLPVAEAMARLKTENRIVKGRAPRENPVPVNPNKVIKTCPWCLRSIALSKDGKMVHHGFERPGDGYQTASCSGIRFQCLEVSTDGLVAYINEVKRLINVHKNALKSLPNVDTLRNPRWSRYSKNISEILLKETANVHEWNNAYDICKARLENDIRFLAGDLKVRQTILDNWVPERN